MGVAIYAVGRLSRHDGLIAWNTLRATFANWHDKALAVFMMLAALAVVHAAMTRLPWTNAAWAAFFAGLMSGISAGRIAAARLSFQASDGLLAADALHQITRRHYMAAWHGVGLTLVVFLALFARPSLLGISVSAYLLGILIAGVTGFVRMPKHIARGTRPGWTMRAWSHRPTSGGAAAMTLLLSLLLARTLLPDAQMALAIIETVLLALMLTTVDHGIVSYMTIAGHGSQSVIVYHAKGMALFVGLTVPGSWALSGPITAGIICAVCIVMLVVMTLRILAYRLQDKRTADFVVSVLVGLFALVAFSNPLVSPAVAVAMLWHLHFRGRSKTWLLE